MIEFDIFVDHKKVITVTDNMVIKALRTKIVEDFKVDPRDVSIVTILEEPKNGR